MFPGMYFARDSLTTARKHRADGRDHAATSKESNLEMGASTRQEQVHGSVLRPAPQPLKRLFAFLGPAYLAERRVHGPGQLGDRPRGGATVRQAPLVWVLDVEHDGGAPADPGGEVSGTATTRPRPRCAEYSRRVNAILRSPEIAIAATDLAKSSARSSRSSCSSACRCCGAVCATAFDVPALACPALVGDAEDGSRSPQAVIDRRCFLLLQLPRPARCCRGSSTVPGRAPRGALRRDRDPGGDGHASQLVPALGRQQFLRRDRPTSRARRWRCRAIRN